MKVGNAPQQHASGYGASPVKLSTPKNRDSQLQTPMTKWEAFNAASPSPSSQGNSSHATPKGGKGFPSHPGLPPLAQPQMGGPSAPMQYQPVSPKSSAGGSHGQNLKRGHSGADRSSPADGGSGSSANNGNGNNAKQSAEKARMDRTGPLGESTLAHHLSFIRTPSCLAQRGYTVVDRVASSNSNVITKIKNNETGTPYICKAMTLQNLHT